jgi:hypothetical protein
MRWPVALSFGVALAVSAVGCRNCDLVEAELRARETDVRELREELERSAFHNQALLQELRTLRGDCPPGEGAATAYPVRALTLGRGTGGYASDNGPGDDALQVVMEPRDPEGHAVKAPGSALIQVVEVTPEGLKRPLSEWDIPPPQLRRCWRSGLFTTGYSLLLPWKVWPSTPKLRVTAQLRLADGRTFEADRDITVHVVPADKRPAPPPPGHGLPTVPTPKPPLAPVPPPPAADRVLPPPRPLPPTPDKDAGPDLGQIGSRGPGPGASTPPPFVWRAVPPPAAAEILRPVGGDR